ncbi:DUF1661 domain-containing protein [Porphyromonas gingivalis]
MPEFLCLQFGKTWRVNFFALAREVKKSRTKTKKIRHHLLQKRRATIRGFSARIGGIAVDGY